MLYLLYPDKYLHQHLKNVEALQDFSIIVARIPNYKSKFYFHVM